MPERDLHGGLVRLHILHHASGGPIFGLGIIEELATHGHRLSAGTLYPILHGLEKAGYLVSRPEQRAGKRRRIYVATKKGRAALREAKAKVWELFRELFEEEPGFHAGFPTSGRHAAKTARTSSRASQMKRREK